MTEPNYGALDAELDASIALPTVWVTKDGREIPIIEMTDAHLRNALRFLRRRAEAYRWAGALQLWSYAEHAPDGAAMAADRAAEELLEYADDDEVVSAFVPEFLALKREANRRRLEQEEDLWQSDGPNPVDEGDK